MNCLSAINELFVYQLFRLELLPTPLQGYEEKNENFKYCAECVADAVFWYEFDEDSDNIDFREIEGCSVHSLDRIDID